MILAFTHEARSTWYSRKILLRMISFHLLVFWLFKVFEQCTCITNFEKTWLKKDANQLKQLKIILNAALTLPFVFEIFLCLAERIALHLNNVQI